jgi:hypothetical protein
VRRCIQDLKHRLQTLTSGSPDTASQSPPLAGDGTQDLGPPRATSPNPAPPKAWSAEPPKGPPPPVRDALQDTAQHTAAPPVKPTALHREQQGGSKAIPMEQGGPKAFQGEQGASNLLHRKESGDRSAVMREIPTEGHHERSSAAAGPSSLVSLQTQMPLRPPHGVSEKAGRPFDGVPVRERPHPGGISGRDGAPQAPPTRPGPDASSRYPGGVPGSGGPRAGQDAVGKGTAKPMPGTHTGPHVGSHVPGASGRSAVAGGTPLGFLSPRLKAALATQLPDSLVGHEQAAPRATAADSGGAGMRGAHAERAGQGGRPSAAAPATGVAERGDGGMLAAGAAGEAQGRRSVAPAPSRGVADRGDRGTAHPDLERHGQDRRPSAAAAARGLAESGDRGMPGAGAGGGQAQDRRAVTAAPFTGGGSGGQLPNVQVRIAELKKRLSDMKAVMEVDAALLKDPARRAALPDGGAEVRVFGFLRVARRHNTTLSCLYSRPGFLMPLFGGWTFLW